MNLNQPDILTALDRHYAAIVAQATTHTAGIARADPIRYRERIEEHLRFLCEAIATRQPAFFLDHVAFQHRVGISYNNIPGLEETLPRITEAVKATVPQAAAEVDAYIDAAMRTLQSAPHQSVSFIRMDQPFGALAAQYLEAILKASRPIATGLILDAATSGVDIRNLYMHVLQPVQYEIGRLWELNRLTPAQEHYGTAITHSVIAQLYPRIAATSHRRGLSVLATSIGGELHDVGIRMVCDMLELDGWTTWYLGANTPTESILRMVTERKVNLLAVSVTMAVHVREVIRLIQSLRSRSQVRVMVGGRAFSLVDDYWRQVGADGYARSAIETPAVADALMDSRIQPS